MWRDDRLGAGLEQVSISLWTLTAHSVPAHMVSEEGAKRTLEMFFGGGLGVFFCL